MTGAHPRACGENGLIRSPHRQQMGSSPRVRGKPAGTAMLRWLCGLIPACAGKTTMAILSRATSWAHPRVCGENTPLMLNPAEIQGSSPRVRGKPLELKRRGVLLRLIPACAGKTLTRTHDIWLPPAHPRVCGENTGLPVGSASPSGSSPRVRGKRRNRSRAQRVHGLIPACAGKTRVSS